MSVNTPTGSIGYRSVRRDGMARFEASYHANGPVVLAEPAMLEHWLTERYCQWCSAREVLDGYGRVTDVTEL